MKHYNVGLLLIIVGFSIVPVYAETGYDYDRTQLDTKTFHWTSHYPRIMQEGQWVNYVWSQSGDVISFESAGIIYKFDKATCSFSLDDPITKEAAIEKYSHMLQINGLTTIPISCDIMVTPEPDSLRITVDEKVSGSVFKTIYNIMARGAMEWTYEISNTDLIGLKTYAISEDCSNCMPAKTEGDLIQLDGYTLDTKNRIHNSLKQVDSKGGLLLVYETDPKAFMGTAVIDPVFSSNNPTEDGGIYDSNLNNGCTPLGDPTYTRTTSSTAETFVWNAGGAPGDCGRFFSQWNTSTIPDNAIVYDTDIILDIQTVVNGRNCDVYNLEKNATAISAAALMEDMQNGTAFLVNNIFCTIVGDNTTVDLGASADSSLQSYLVSLNYFGIGIKFNNESTDGANHDIDFLLEEEAGTPNPTLQVSYIVNDIEVTDIVDNVGDIARITGSITKDSLTDYLNITSIRVLVNGTLINANGTDHNSTGADVINYGPVWYQMTTSDVYNFTSFVASQDILYQNITDISSTLITREYDPDYFTAEVPAQGDVNYTFNDNILKVNRDKGGATWQIECFVQDWSQTFFLTDDGTWYNDTTIGAFSQTLPANSDHYATCYNDDELFTAALAANYTNYLLPGLVVFDQLGGLMGAPAALVMVLAIYSLATGRNFPIIAVIGMSVIGIMGALGLLVLDGAVWGLLMVLTGLILFGVRKFF